MRPTRLGTYFNKISRDTISQSETRISSLSLSKADYWIPGLDCHNNSACQLDYIMHLIQVDPKILNQKPKNSQLLTPQSFLVV